MVSVVIPVYNTPKDDFFIMLDSLLKQTYKEYEILIVDDGSKEETCSMLKEVTKNCENVRLFFQSNHGVSATRNYGASEANGDYVTFVDADDTLSPTFLEEAVTLANAHEADIVYGSILDIPEIHDWRQVQKQGEEVDVFHSVQLDDVKASLLGYRYGKLPYIIMGSPCGRLIRRSLLQNVTFDTSMAYWEDQIFNLDLLEHARKVVVSPKVWYFYKQNEYSAFHTVSLGVKYYEKVIPYWDALYKRKQTSSKYIQNVMSIRAMGMYANFISEAFLHTVDAKKDICNTMKKAAEHPLIADALMEKLPNEMAASRGQKMAYFFLKKKMYLTLLFIYKRYAKTKK